MEDITILEQIEQERKNEIAARTHAHNTQYQIVLLSQFIHSINSNASISH